VRPFTAIKSAGPFGESDLNTDHPSVIKFTAIRISFMAPTVPLLIDILSSFGTVADYDYKKLRDWSAHKPPESKAALSGTDQSQLGD